jgi:hypothetical protein
VRVPDDDANGAVSLHRKAKEWAWVLALLSALGSGGVGFLQRDNRDTNAIEMAVMRWRVKQLEKLVGEAHNAVIPDYEDIIGGK